MALPERRDQVQAIADSDACGERALRCGLDYGAVGDRVGEGNSDLDHVRAALDDCVEQSRARFRSGIAEHQEGAERAFAAQPLEHRGIASHASSACA